MTARADAISGRHDLISCTDRRATKKQCNRLPETCIAHKGFAQTVFQQVAFGVEAISDTWNVNVYALVPVDDTEYQLNSVYDGGSLDTYGVDVGYSVTSEFETSIGYYYQKGDLGTADGSGVQGRVAYNIGSGFSIGTNMS